jgi:hypothetical protein
MPHKPLKPLAGEGKYPMAPQARKAHSPISIFNETPARGLSRRIGHLHHSTFRGEALKGAVDRRRAYLDALMPQSTAGLVDRQRLAYMLAHERKDSCLLLRAVTMPRAFLYAFHHLRFLRI